MVARLHQESEDAQSAAWHQQDAEPILNRFRSSSSGLGEAEALQRLSEYGHNSLDIQRRRTALGILLRQLMHAIVSFVSIALSPETLTGARLLTFLLVSAAMMWLLLAAVGAANNWRLSRQPARSSIG